MKGPVCSTDVKTGKLCKICEAKLKAGQICELDFSLMKAIEKLENKKYLIATEIVRAFELDDLVIIFASGNVGALIGKDGKNVKQLEQELGKKIRVIELGKDRRETIQQVLGRARINAVNRVFKPEAEELKVMVDSRDRAEVETNKEKFEEMLQKVLKQPIEIAFA